MTSIRTANEPGDPLEMLRDLASANEWHIDRASEDEIHITYQGPWEEYKLHFHWQPRAALFRIACMIGWEMGPERWASVKEMLTKVNEQLWLGHFSLTEQGYPIYRYSLLLNGTDGITPEQLDEIVETAIGECDRLYPAFHFICDGRSPDNALQLAILDVMGEA